MPPFVRPARAVSTALKELGDAANEAARREAPQWFYFVTIMITLAALVGSTTHRVLFLEQPVRVPILGVEVPLLGFYVAAPVLFLVLHFHLLAQMRLMADKIAAYFRRAEQEAVDEPEVIPRAIRRLDSFPLAQLLASRWRGERAVALSLMIWTTFAILPLTLLLFFQLRFLPYQDVWITWLHRGVLILDLAILWWLWPLSVVADHRRGRPRRVATLAASVSSAALVVFSVGIATVPEEWLVDALPVAALRTPLFDGEVDDQTLRPSTPFSRRIVLPNEILIPPEDLRAFREDLHKAMDLIQRTTVLRGRSLKDAVLVGVDLRRADLSYARLQGARLSGAQIQGASFVDAQMQGAMLDAAQMQGAILDRARLQGAWLFAAQMQGASLLEAQMQGATLDLAQMQGAVFDRAQMQAARLIGTQMQGASFKQVRMQAASFTNAGMQGAVFDDAGLQGALFTEAQMQGAVLDGAQMQGALILASAVWRARARSADLSLTVILRTEIESRPPLLNRQTDEAGPAPRFASWPEAVTAWTQLVPPGPKRTTAQARFWPLLVHPNDGVPEEYRDYAAVFADRSADQAPRAEILNRLACGEAGAPFVAERIARIVIDFLRSPQREEVAVLLLDSSRCPGARGLSAERSGRLRGIAATGR